MIVTYNVDMTSVMHYSVVETIINSKYGNKFHQKYLQQKEH